MLTLVHINKTTKEIKIKTLQSIPNKGQIIFKAVIIVRLIGKKWKTENKKQNNCQLYPLKVSIKN